MRKIRRNSKKENQNNAKAGQETKANQLETMADPSASSPESTESKEFPIVGIGASAGGLEALIELLENLPLNRYGLHILQHLASGESMLTDILSRSTTMPVHTVKNEMPVEPNSVYVIPPT